MINKIYFCWFQVSWLWYTDLLTVGKNTYTGDNRIKSSFSYPNNWRLEMVDLQKKDSGLYVCQISTHPPVGLHTVIRVKGENILQHLKKNIQGQYS